MHFTVEVERETDKRWIAEVVDLPGVLTYGATRKQAIARAQVLALRVLADKIEHGEKIPAVAERFVVAACACGARRKPSVYLLPCSELVGG